MTKKTTIKVQTIVDIFSELSIRQAGKLIKAVAAYNAEKEYDEYLDEYLKPVFLLLINQ